MKKSAGLCNAGLHNFFTLFSRIGATNGNFDPAGRLQLKWRLRTQNQKFKKTGKTAYFNSFNGMLKNLRTKKEKPRFPARSGSAAFLFLMTNDNLFEISMTTVVIK